MNQQYIYMMSLDAEVVPNDQKRANVTAIYKTGSHELPDNYRPLSLTSHVCKISESNIRDAILEHVNKYNLMKDLQHSFVIRISCLTNLLEFLETATNNIDQSLPINVIYLDFQKSFNKVYHKRLKAKSQDITGIAFDWIKDWLQDTEQRIVLLGVVLNILKL